MIVIITSFFTDAASKTHDEPDHLDDTTQGNDSA